jgi:hypothetical protein
MITPQLAVQYIQGEPANRHKEIHEFVVSASARDLLQTVCLLDIPESGTFVPSREWQIRIGMALDVRLAEEAAESARKIERYTRWLIGLTIALVVIALPDLFRLVVEFCHNHVCSP